MHLLLLPVALSTEAIRCYELLRLKTGLQENILFYPDAASDIVPAVPLGCVAMLHPPLGTRQLNSALRSVLTVQNKGCSLWLIFSVLGVGVCLFNDSRRKELLL